MFFLIFEFYALSIVLCSANCLYVASRSARGMRSTLSLYEDDWQGPSPHWDHPDMHMHVSMLAMSFKAKTGRELMDCSDVPALRAKEIFNADFILLSHGIQSSPILNYANKRGLETWGAAWDELTCMPSSQTAEPGVDATERAEFMRKVTEFGVVEGYHGVRISADGKYRFKIKDAVVWNVHNAAGEYIGQAATFREVEPVS